MLSITPPTTQQIETKVIELIEEMTDEWDLDETLDEISPASHLIADLSFASVDFVQLFVSIEEAFARKLGFHDLIMPNDKYVEDLSIAQIVAYIEAKLHPKAAPASLTASSATVTAKPVQRLTATAVSQFRQLIPTPAAIASSNPSKNPPAVFILSPPRSGSTLLRVMLAGHPQLFAPPELHLLTYETLQQRQQALDNDLNRHLLIGAVRALKQLNACSDEAAQEHMTAYAAQNLTVQEFYLKLQEALCDRILVDKTPSYTYHVNILKRIESLFDNARYIHLVRHPYGMIRSFEDAKLDQLVPFMRDSSFSSRERAELIWLTSHQNILSFLQQIEPERHLKVCYEDLVKAAEPTMQQICGFLQIPFVSSMLNPYQDKDQRMTDGVQAVLQTSGDLKFHLHSGIEANMADRWKQFHTEDFLGDVSLEVARSFGYEV
ncbi:MAG TPA: sulfotransferase [Leptolyngbyaceae cyanobacterium]